MDEERFAAALQAAQYDMGCRGIGTMKEKSLHIALKHYFAPDPDTHERSVGGFIADAVTEDGVVEIQTRSLSRLKEKLTAFLEACPVTVVHPIANPKWLATVDENGVLQGRRKSPKHETMFTAMREIYTLRDFLTNPRFQLCIASVELTEYRVAHKKGRRVQYEKLDRVPNALNKLRFFASPHDYLTLLPAHLPREFSAKQAAEAAASSVNDMRMLLTLLVRMNALEICGKQGNARIYRITDAFVSDDIRG